MRAGCVWEWRRRRHLPCPPPPPALPAHIPLGPNLSPLSSQIPQPQITQAWQLTLSQPVISHKSLHTFKENFCVVLTGSCAPALAGSPVPCWALRPRADTLPQACCLCSPGGSTPLQYPGKAPQLLSCLCCPPGQPWAQPAGSQHCDPNTVRLLQPMGQPRLQCWHCLQSLHSLKPPTAPPWSNPSQQGCPGRS